MESSNDSKKSFFKYVFNFDEDSKSELMNIIQFALIGIIPVILLIKLINKYLPEIDDKKGSIEILAEIVIEVVSLFIGVFFILRIVTFFPTFSGADYPKISILTIILSLLIGIISVESTLTDKINVIIERIYNLWEGKSSDKKKNASSNVKVSQPISQKGITQPVQTRQYSDGTSIQSLPTHDVTSASQSAPQQLPDYNAMYRNDNNPLVNAANPVSQAEAFEPMAASDALGGSWGGFSSW
jgi:hypothetical protein